MQKLASELLQQSEQSNFKIYNRSLSSNLECWASSATPCNVGENTLSQTREWQVAAEKDKTKKDRKRSALRAESESLKAQNTGYYDEHEEQAFPNV